MACARLIVLSVDAIQASMAASSVGCQRSPICVPRPVVGRPRVFLVTFIDFFMVFGYHKIEPRGSWNFRPGSNPQHEV
jgi:hypothetical protein